MFIEAPFKERIWVRAHCGSQESLLPAGPPARLTYCGPEQGPTSVSLFSENTYYTFSPRILGSCFVQTTITKVVCLLGQCTVKYKGKEPLCGNIVGNVFGCLDSRLQNAKASSPCRFVRSFLKMPKPTNEISKEVKAWLLAFPPSVSPNVLEAAGQADRQWAY